MSVPKGTKGNNETELNGINWTLKKLNWAELKLCEQNWTEQTDMNQSVPYITETKIHWTELNPPEQNMTEYKLTEPKWIKLKWTDHKNLNLFRLNLPAKLNWSKPNWTKLNIIDIWKELNLKWS